MRHSNRFVSSGKAASVNAAHSNASRIISRTIERTLSGVQREVASRAYRASNELRNSLLYTMRGDGGGEFYQIPHTKKIYRASKPGEVPAVRTGVFRLSWSPRIKVDKNGKDYSASAQIESGIRVGKYILGDLLENGGGRMAARPYKKKVIDRATPKIKAIYNKPYKL